MGTEAETLKLKLCIAKFGFWTALVTAVATMLDKFSGFLTGLEVERQAPPPPYDPENPHIEVTSEAPASMIAFPTHWVIVILCLLVILACLLAYKGYKKRHRRATQILI